MIETSSLLMWADTAGVNTENKSDIFKNYYKENNMSITILRVVNETDLYCHYDRQSSHQPCYVALNCERETLSASYNSEIGNAIPFSVWYGHVQRFNIPCLTATEVNNLMKEIASLAQRVCTGYKSTWDGNNHVAQFNSDAQTAIEEIRSICDSMEDSENIVQVWNAYDYLDSVARGIDTNGTPCNKQDAVKVVLDDYGTITAKTTNEEIHAIEKEIMSSTEDNMIVEGVTQLLQEYREYTITNS